mgnify:CR=1 FL=1
MRKYTVLGGVNELDLIAIKLLRLHGYDVTVDDNLEAKNYLMKTVLCFGNVGDELLVNVLQKAKVVVFLGLDGRSAEIIRDYVEQKDIPKMISKIDSVTGAEAWYNERNTYEVYTSNNITSLELVCRFLISVGQNTQILMRYVSQYYTKRNSGIFDHDNISELQEVYEKFMEYSREKEEFEQDEINQIYFNYGRLQ